MDRDGRLDVPRRLFDEIIPNPASHKGGLASNAKQRRTSRLRPAGLNPDHATPFREVGDLM